MQSIANLLFLATAALISGTGAFCAFKGQNKKLKIVFFIFSLLLAGWNFAYFKFLNSADIPDSKMWLRIFSFLGISVPAAYFYFLSEFLNSSFLRKSAGIASGSAILILGYAAFVGFSAGAGAAAMAFSALAAFGALILSFTSLYSDLRGSVLTDRKSRAALLSAFCFLIGVFLNWLYGESIFFPAFGWTILLVSISLQASYVARFPALEARFILIQSAKWIIIIGFAVSPIILLIYYNHLWILVQKNSILALVSLIVFYAIFAYLALIHPIIDRIFGRRFFKKQEALRSFFYSVSSLSSLDEMLSKAGDLFQKTFRFQKTVFFIFDDKKHKFSMIFENPKSSRAKKEIFTTQDNDFWEYWAIDNRILTSRDGSTFENARAAHSFARLIKYLDADVLFPLVFAGSFIGFFALAADSLKEGLRLENLRIYDEMRDELSIMFSNSALYEKTRVWNASLEEKIKERTKELQKINDKLAAERNTAKMFSRMIVQRELEMIKLKKKIKMV